MTDPILKIDEIFWGALQRTAGGQRQSYLDEQCGGNAELRELVEKLLRAQPKAEQFLETPLEFCPPTSAPTVTECPGTQIGPYKLLQQIGEGGMGVVYMAEQTEPVKRRVALKIIKPGMDSRQVIARFEAERQALSMMDHPHIAKVFEAGTTGTASGYPGRPYFVMELVKGQPITQYCDEHHFTPRQRLELLLPVCQAIQHAHQKGIIHRDIKPTNILVAEYDNQPVPKVIDFGVAKAISQSLTEKTMFTGLGQIVGTLEYMSPEQAKVNQLDIDTRSDIYSLGVLMYELLTGSTPLDKVRLRSAGWDEMLRIIREEEPPKPSTKVSSSETLPAVAANRSMEPARLSRTIRGELDWIVMKALEKDRNSRYETANGFAMDLQRYLADEMVEARPPSAGYRLKKFVRRHKGQVIAASLVLLALIAGMVGTTLGLLEARKQEAVARNEANAKEHARSDEAAQRLAAVEAASAERLAKERAEADFALANEAVEKYLGTVTADPDLKRVDLNRLRKKLLEGAIPFFQRIAERKSDDPDVESRRAQAHLRLASLRGVLEEHVTGLHDAEAARAILTRLTADFPDVPRYEELLANSHQALGQTLESLRKLPEATAAFRLAVALRKNLADRFTDNSEYRHDLSISLNSLGTVLNRQDDRGESEAALSQAMEIQQTLADQFPDEPRYRRSLAQSRNNFATVVWFQGKVKEAEAAYRNAADIQQLLVNQFPDDPEYRLDLAKHLYNLGILYSAANRTKKEATLRQALSHFEKLAEQFPTVPAHLEGVARVSHNLGDLFVELGEREKAEAAYQRALDQFERLAELFPTVPKYFEMLVESYSSLGALLANGGKGESAVAILRRSLDFHQRHVERVSNGPRYRESLAGIHHRLGNLLRDLRKGDEAEAEYRRAVDILAQLADEFPDQPNYKQALAESHNCVGAVLSDPTKREEAEAAYRRALDIREQLVAEYPNQPDYAIDLGGSYCNIGHLIHASGQPEAAVGWYEKAIERLEPMAARTPPVPRTREFLLNSRFGRATALDGIGRHGEAQADWKRALELDSGGNVEIIRSNLAASRVREFRDAKDAAGCLAAAAEFEALKRTTGIALYNAACNRAICAAVIPQDPKTPPADAAALANKHADLALAWLHQAVAAGFTDAAKMQSEPDLVVLREREDFKKLIEELKAKKN